MSLTFIDTSILKCTLVWPTIQILCGCHSLCYLKVFNTGPTFRPALVSVGVLDGRYVSVCVQGALWVTVMLWVQAQLSTLSWMSFPLFLPGFNTANLCLWWGYRVNMVFYQQESDSPQLSTSINLNHTHTRKHTQVSHSAIRSHPRERRHTGVSHS